MESELLHNAIYKSLNIIPHCEPKEPNMNSVEKRKESFIRRNWNYNLPVKYMDLVEAGFYYTGIEDKVLCFHCNGGLQNWSIGDDPWVEHARFYNDCGYLRFMKSEAFIKCCKTLYDEFENSDVNFINHVSKFDDSKLTKTIDEWMESEIVQKLVRLNVFSNEILKRTLYDRYQSQRKPFLTFEELYKAVSKTIENAKDQLVVMAKFLAISTNSCSSLSHQTFIPKDEENSINEKLICKLCFTNEISVVFLPCAHQFICLDCMQKISICPICPKRIQAYVKTIIS